MNRRFVRSRKGGAACAVTLLIALAACTGGGGDGDGDSAGNATTCDDLQQEANGCTTSDPATKDQFAQVGATCKAQARFTAECRKCLSGKICGVTESCDPLCGK